mmetsp:Transcript_21736/g.42729  ORF Transcript_21736/g.42729 Transcript_21736/m.42729 type:complete len:1166 (+) Transcript_21736:650-4147(+)
MTAMISQIFVGGMTCGNCAATVTRAGEALDGVRSCVVNVVSGTAEVKFDGTVVNVDRVVETIEDVGFEAEVAFVREDNSAAKNRRARASFRLGGLTCSSCANAVEKAVRKLDGVDPAHISVAVLPENRLDVRLDLDKTSAQQVVEAVESIGFEAELETCHEDKDRSQEDFVVRTIILRLAKNAGAAKRYIEALPGVKSVNKVEDPKATKKRRKNAQQNQGRLTNRTLGEVPDLEQRLLDDQGPEGGDLEVIFDDRVLKLRKLRQDLLREDGAVQCDSLEIMDRTSFAMHHRASEDRRQAEMDNWWRDLKFALIFAVPVFTVSMVLCNFPAPVSTWLMSECFAGITWEEAICWVLATPVQFVSGARFYREAWHSIRSRSLGMAILVVLGTSTAYGYSVFAVLYNASMPTSMERPRLMQMFESSALLISFVLLGKYLEAQAKASTSVAIDKLAKLTPDTARILTDDGKDEEETSLVLLQRDDIVIVRPGERIACDGTIEHGSASIDESMLTGESVPVNKKKGDEVIGGTICVDGSLQIRVSVTGEGSTLAQIIQLVEKAQTSKAPIQVVADRIAGRFVPFVLCCSVLTFVFWLALLKSGLIDEAKASWPYHNEGLNDTTFALLFGISVLVIACPCALGLATPTAVMVGSGVGAEHGILIKGGEALEIASKVTAVVFDKTGTLTEGAPSVDEIMLLSNRLYVSPNHQARTCGESLSMLDFESSETGPAAVAHDKAHANDARDSVMRNVMFFAACAENGSEHPLARGILAKAKSLGIGPAPSASDNASSSSGATKTSDRLELIPTQDFVSEAGRGVQCIVGNHMVHLGNRRSLESNKIEVRDGTNEAMEYLESRGMTAVCVSVDGKTEAVLGLIDRARDEAAQTVSALQHVLGVQVYMLTGDNSRTAAVVAADIGIDLANVVADVLPADKVACIERLQREAPKNGAGRSVIAMVGDGINDSPALAQADIGIAVGAGTDVAIEAAGLVLVNSKLTDVLIAIDLARVIYSRIRWNFVWALGYNTLAIPLAAGVLYPFIHVALPPFVAAAAMALSSISVVTMSLLLKRYKPPKIAQRKYGRTLRNGTLGLESLDIIIRSQHKQEVQVRCVNMQNGLPCACPPETCECTDCEEHAVKSTREVFMPGCARAFGGPCNCGKNCSCGESCTCGQSE